MNGPDTQKLPCDLFTTEWVDAPLRWPIWRETASVVFDAAPPPEGPFTASIQAFYPGSIAFTETQATPLSYERSRRKIARDAMDHFMVTLYLDGGVQGSAGTKEVALGQGDICILDLGQPVRVRHLGSRTFSLFVPRAALDSVLPASNELHGSVLQGGGALGAMLTDQLMALRRRLPDLTVAEGPQVADALADFVAACFRPTAESLNRARAQVATATLDLIKNHIELNLTTPALSPDSIAATFRMSRSTLYRLFEPLGGVAAYIQERRLLRAYAALTRPANRRRPVYDIAFDCGFASEAHFSRAFRQAFGLTPSALRALGATPGDLLFAGGQKGLSGAAGYSERLARCSWWAWRG
jgi:AraC-like DNA-binding protein